MILAGLVFLSFQYLVKLAPTQGVGGLPTATAAAWDTSPGGLGAPNPPTPVPTVARTAVKSTATTGRSLTATATPLSPGEESLQALASAVVPARDLYSLVARLKLKSTTPLPRTIARMPGDYKIGHKEVFYVSDISEKHYYTITATLHEVTEHAYWYVQDGRNVEDSAVQRAARNFEQTILPTNRALFGTEWTPGVDNDPRITVLFAPLSGASGYFSSADEYVRALNPVSNEREIMYITASSGLNGVESTIAHEYQHMIHWAKRPNHDVWLNEGAAVLASAVNGYDVMGVDDEFLRNPGVQLTAWQSSPSGARANYGASYLFVDYLRTHYGGDKVVRSLVSAPGTGIDAVDNALVSVGRSERFNDVFKRWTLANLVDTWPGAGEQRLDYPERDVQVVPQLTLDRYPTGNRGEVSQYGTQYVRLRAPQSSFDSLSVYFSGEEKTRIVSTEPYSGQRVWWSNRGDLANTRMTKSFDLRKLASATLNFQLWFDIEAELDYAYVEASTDGGATWDTLQGAYTTNANPNGNAYGHTYTGRSADKSGADSNGWLRESIDISRYAGKEVQIRFEYVTDDGYNAEGLVIDDISIPELSYLDDAEKDTGWISEGFVRIANELPQRYSLSVVKFKDGGFDLQTIEVDSEGKANFTIEGFGDDGYSEAVLLISGLTPYTTQQSNFALSVRPGR